MTEHAEELQRRRNKAPAAAVQNRENARGENESAQSENENASSENKKTAEDGGRVQFSKDYDYSKSFSEQIEDYKSGNFPRYDTLIVSGTPCP